MCDSDMYIHLQAIRQYSYTFNYLAFFPYDGYYSETDRTGTVQKTIPSLKCQASIQRHPPTPMMYIPT